MRRDGHLRIQGRKACSTKDPPHFGTCRKRMFLLERLNRPSLVFCGTSKSVSVPLLLGVASTVPLLSTFLVGQKYDSIVGAIQPA